MPPAKGKPPNRRQSEREVFHMKHTARKGFTLIELIIVLALFSIIMYSVVQLLGPISKFFVRSSNFENTTACVDNLRRAIENNLKYADRVRVYAGYEPYVYANDTITGTDGVTITYKKTDFATTKETDGVTSNLKVGGVGLQNHVNDFYNEFFKDRKLLGTNGKIYVMVFDNTEIVSDLQLMSNCGLLSDFTDNALNRGRIVLYEYDFNSYAPSFNTAQGDTNCTPWYVNQKLYSNFEYTYNIGSSDDFTLDTDPSFNPQSCSIRIHMTEIAKQGDGLARIDTEDTRDTVSSFAMKNVLKPQTNKTYPVAAEDYVLEPNPAAAAASKLDKYIVTRRPKRFMSIRTNTDPDPFNGFYFIYTLPETVGDDVGSDTEYKDAIDALAP